MNPRKYRQILVIIAVVFLAVPQITMAAWWNPLSWSIWNVSKPTPQIQTQKIQIATTTISVPTTVVATTTKKVEKIIKIEKPKNNKDVEIELLKKQIDGLSQKVSQPKVVEQPKTSIVTFPSGKVVEMDVSGNIVRTITEAPQQTYTPSITPSVDTAAQDKQNQINSIIASCNVQINKINQQIIDLKNNYYMQLPGILSTGTSAIAQGNADGLLNQTNLKISQLALQIQQIQLDCQGKISYLQ